VVPRSNFNSSSNNEGETCQGRQNRYIQSKDQEIINAPSTMANVLETATAASGCSESLPEHGKSSAA
jgi:hypothetical protein